MPRRVRRYLKAVVSLAFLVFLAAACSSDGYPVSYADQQDPETGISNVQANWMQGCEVGFGDSDLANAANSICQCSYNAISASDGIPFEDFVALDDDLKGDPESLQNSENLTAAENRLVDIVKNCIAEG